MTDIGSIKKIMAIVIMSMIMAAPFSSAYAVPSDENFDDDSALSEAGNFTNDGITYTIGGTMIGTIMSNDSTSPLGDDGADYYMNVGTDTSLTIGAEGGGSFRMNSFAIDALADANILITPSSGSAVTLVSNNSWVTQTVDLSANDDFKNITSFTISGSNLILYIDDLDFEAPVLPTYTVAYDGNTNSGGAVPTDGNSYNNGDTVTVLGNTGSLIKTGYTFTGWNTAANGSGTSYSGGDTFSMGSSNVTLYAQWTAIDYSVTYDGNTNTGGSVPTDGNTYNITDTVTVLGNTGSLTKTGYSFNGWNTAANGSGAPYNGGATFAMGSSNVTLYAQWTENSYTVTYNGNSNTGGAVPVDGTSYHNGDTATVLGNTGSLVRTGYTFAGWNTASNGSGTSYTGGDTFSIGLSNVTLYAQWTAIDYTVTYDGNTNTGGSVPTDGNVYNIADTVTVLGNTGSLTKTGYSFNGWNTAANGSGTDYAGGDTFAMGSSNVTLYAQWVENTYAVTYNGNSNTGGSVPVDGTTYHNGDTATVLGNTGSLVRTGYTFNGWNTVANGSGTSYTGGDTFGITTSSVTLYAQWTAIDYTVTYDGNTNTGGSVPVDGNTYNITNTVTVLGNTGSLVKTGYTFDGWNTAANGSGTDYSGGDTFSMGSTNVTLYAQWIENTYTVTYNGNSNTGGAVPVDGTTYHNGGTATVLGNTGFLVRTGYTFAGWNTAANGTGTSYTGGDTFGITTSSVTLYAQWTAIDYTVTYNGNTSTGGFVPTDGNTYNITDTVTVLGNIGSLTKTGYTFNGWNTAGNGSGTSYNGGDTFAMGSSNVTLYAQWTENTYTVAYNGNFNTGGSVPVDGTTYHNGDTATVLGNTGSLVRTGYTFAGWNTAANGSGTDYISGDTFAMGSSNVTFYAKWTENPYTVTYNGNGNTGGAVPLDGTGYNNGDAVTVLGNTGSLVKTGYTFAGWNTAANGSGMSYIGGETFVMGLSNVTLYATWTESIYGVTYDGNTNTGGFVPVDGNTYYNADTVTVLSNTGSLVKLGYTFTGWNTVANGSGNGYYPGGTFPMGLSNVTLYAQWTENIYTVTYSGNGNTGGALPVDGTSYHNGDTATVLGNTGSLVRAGYTFTGWNTAANGSGTPYSGEDTFSIGFSNVTLYAQWTAINYTVTYDGNTNTGGSVPVDRNTYNINDTVIVLGNTGSLVKTGYTFNGWNTAANGSGTSYAGGVTISMPSSNVILFAQWTQNTYTVVYDGNSNTGGSSPVDDIRYGDSDTATVLGNTGSLLKTGYAFTGWNTAADGSGTSYTGGDTFGIAATNVTLYAQWTTADYMVIYDGNANTGGSVPTDGNTYNINDTVTVLGDAGSLMKTGYTFSGWGTAADGSGTSYTGGDTFSMGSSNVILYAQWQGNYNYDTAVESGEILINDGTINNLSNEGTVSGGSVGGTSSNSGLLDGVSILQDGILDNQAGTALDVVNEGIIHGGTLSGEVENYGLITGTSPDGVEDPAYAVTVETGATVFGGTLAGQVVNRGTLANVTITSGTRIVFEQDDDQSVSGRLEGTVTLVDERGGESTIHIPAGSIFPDIAAGGATEIEFTFESLRSYAEMHGWDVTVQSSSAFRFKSAAIQNNVKAASTSSLPPLPEEFLLVDGLMISEEGIPVSGTVDLDVPYEADNIPIGFDEDDLLLLSYDTNDGAWKQISFSNSGDGFLSVSIEVLSAYAIALNRSDEQSAGVDMSALDGNPSENGGTAVFSLALTRQPLNDVHMSLSVSDDTEIRVEPSEIVFTPDNYILAQTVTVTGLDDELVDGDISCNIVISSLVSEDPAYNGLNPTDLIVVNTDNEIPTLILPLDGEVDAELMPLLQMAPFGQMDPDFIHTRTQWQISYDPAFIEEDLVLELTSAVSIESFSVPVLLLEKGTTYFWRVRAYDADGNASLWSQTLMFTTTVTNNNDLDEDGIPDDQAVSDTEDLDQDGIADNQQADIKSAISAVGGCGIAVKTGNNTLSVLSITAIDPDTISDSLNRPDSLDIGLVGFKILVSEPGDTAEVTLYLSEEVAEGANWYKYSPAGGWQDFSQFATISADGMSVTLRLTDGGEGDLDGVANGIIIDTSGPDTLAVPDIEPEPTTVSGASGGGGGCFVSLAVDGKRKIDLYLLGIGLLLFLSIVKKCGLRKQGE